MTISRQIQILYNENIIKAPELWRPDHSSIPAILYKIKSLFYSKQEKGNQAIITVLRAKSSTKSAKLFISKIWISPLKRNSWTYPYQATTTEVLCTITRNIFKIRLDYPPTASAFLGDHLAWRAPLWSAFVFWLSESAFFDLSALSDLFKSDFFPAKL